MKAIETRAYGCRFRSRLEARWAVCFTALGLSWEYEPEGFRIGDLLYLPDFRVYTPQGKPIWYEIKPSNVCQDQKFDYFLKSLKASIPDDVYETPRASLLNGDPYSYFMNHNPISVCPRCGCFGEYDYFWNNGNFEIMCYSCDGETASGGGNPTEYDGFLGCHYRPNKGWIETDYYWINYITTDKLLPAMEKARSVRFEHGESPQ